MIYLIGVWMGLLVVCQVIGLGGLNWVVGGVSLRSGDRLILSLWLGVITLAVASMFASLFVPLTPLYGAIVVGILLAITGRSVTQPFWQILTREQWGLGLGAIGLLAAAMSRPVTWHDAGYYHASAIRWFAEYGSVHGIALLFNNLGFTSSWFSLVAPLSGPGVAQTTVVGNGFAALLLLLQGLMAWRRLWRGQGTIADRFIALFATGALGLSLTVSPFSQVMLSPSPDFPVLVLVGTIAWALLVIAPLAVADRARLSYLPLILALGAVTMKLTAMPALGVAGLFLLWHHARSPRSWLLGGGLVALMLGPNIVSSLITSGCPLYPSALFCLDVPWAPTAQAAQKVAAGTHDWASWYGTPPAGVHPWFWAVTQVLKGTRDRLVFLAMGLSGLAGLTVLWKARRSFARQPLTGELWVMLLGVTGIGFLLVTSIFIRFLVPYLLLLLALVGAIGWGQSSRLGRSAIRPITSRPLYLGLTTIATAIMLVNLVRSHGQTALLPPPLPTSAIVQKQTNAIVYSAPKSGDLPLYDGSPYHTDQVDRCWAAPIPCAYQIAPDVQLRDPAKGVAAGFERRQTEDLSGN
jgi:hypothetical protein